MVQSFRFAIVPLRQSLFYGGWNPTTTGILMIVGEIARLIELQSWRITSTLIVGKYDFWLRDYDNPNILASISLYKSSPNCWNIWVFLWSPSSWTVMFNWLHPTIVIRFESLYILYIYISLLVVLTILKNMKVNGKDDIPYIMEHKKMFQTTNQILYIATTSSSFLYIPLLHFHISHNIGYYISYHCFSWSYPIISLWYPLL